MSTKTLLKRLALATVVALGAGVLSLVSVSSANAVPAAGDITVGVNGATGASNPAGGITAVSAGLLSGAGTATGTAALTMTATLLTGGTLAVNVTAPAAQAALVVTGGTISSAIPATIDNAGTDYVLAADGTAYGEKSSAGAFSVLIKPNSGVTSFTVQSYLGGTSTTLTSTSGATLHAQLIVTVASTSVSGAFSAAKSFVNTAVVGTSTNAGVDIVNAHSASVTTIPNGEKAQINFILNDAYSVPLSAGAVIASTTGGVGFVKLDTTKTNTPSPTASTDVQTATAGALTVSQSVANAPQTVTVSLSYNGTVVTTRTFNFLGEVAKLVVSNPRVVGVNETAPTTTATAAFTARYYDSAGNELFPRTDQTTATTLVSGLAGQVVSAATISTAGDGVSTSAPFAVGAVTGITKGSASLQMQYVNATDGTIIKSNTWTQYVAGDADSYTAKFDKASYTPGSIATLTITFKDSKGNLANHLVGKIAAAGETITIAGAPGTVVSAPTTSDVAGGGTDAAGTITYQFTVTQVEGSYSAIVAVPHVNSTANGVSQTVAYSVATGSTSLNDVLKGIVSLIASINKQIAALAKLVAPAKKK